ncbi:uncharacterized protein BX663DRAFT_542793 [Cokeromyces recurvatus]|uniref:uncharacterized protein n=1 Tax=Cokeromyces recurvatus TaxID=90255 RepID=UPI00221E3E90|nr:uncharacterized protein BX663DRAFT_542793 [Cokeromyces recurvatus]KAI7903319.1 hypothetical protein BX663DRAFT_542793 [Cokeromyces recurvatus]
MDENPLSQSISEDFEDLFDDDTKDSICSEASSIPDENIDFNLVYALHTFVATIDGQTSVVKGDSMVLLDDSNSYWWLIKALKTSEVGYIPAENIETPFERLARLNKHRNVEIASLPYYVEQKSSSTKKKKVQMSNVCTYQAQIIITDNEDEHSESYEETYEEWEEDLNKEPLETTTRYSPVTNPDFCMPIIEELEELSFSNTVDIQQPFPPDEPFPPTSLTENHIVPEITNDQQHMLINNKVSKNIEEQQDVGVVKGLKQLLSIGNKTKKSNDEILVDNGNNMQYHVLRIFSEDINGAMFSSVAVTPDMNTEQVIQLALQKFHIVDNQPGVEYYVTVKSIHSDEITLTPQDKPLAIFESLSDHLTTPMPSLTHIKRLSVEQPTIKVTRIGISKARQRAEAHFGEDSFIRFSLHKRIKRTSFEGEQIYIKITHYIRQQQYSEKGGGLTRKSSLLNADRMDKLVAVNMSNTVTDLMTIMLEKFHLTHEDKSMYCVRLSVNGKETLLDSSQTIADILKNPELNPPGTTVEKLFVLCTKRKEGLERNNSRRFMGLLKQQLQQQQQQQQQPKIETNDKVIEPLNTSNVIRRLDEAIQSLENDKRQFENNKHIFLKPPKRSNSLSKMSRPIQHLETRRLPTRSSSLKLSYENKKQISNMDDLQNELHRIASSHNDNTTLRIS